MVPQQVKEEGTVYLLFSRKSQKEQLPLRRGHPTTPRPVSPPIPPLPPLAPASCWASETLCWAKNHRETFPVNVSHMSLPVSMFGKTLPVSAPHVSLFVTSCLCPSLRFEWVEPVAVSQ